MAYHDAVALIIAQRTKISNQAAALKEAEKYINDIRRNEHDIYNLVAPKLGLKPYGKSQIIWANSKKEADSLLLGDDIFKFVKIALSKEST